MWRIINQSEKRTRINHFVNKLAEIDYMLFVIDRDQIPRQKELYRQYTYSELKELLSKRLVIFVDSEVYRDLNESQNKPTSLSA